MTWFSDQLGHVFASQWATGLLLASVIAIVGTWLARTLARALGRLLARFEVDPILIAFLRNLAYGIGLVVVAVAALDALGVPTTSLLAVLGAGGLAIGLALKDSLSNLASGVMLIVLRPFRGGDYVIIAGLEGVIDQVRLFQTVLHTADNREIILPNSQITAAPIINFSKRGSRRIDLEFLLAYDEELPRVRDALLAHANAHADVLKEPAAEVVVIALADNGVRLQLRAWARSGRIAECKAQLLEGAWGVFRTLDIQPPAPARPASAQAATRT